MSILLVDLKEVCRGEIVNRPSKKCKTPYVADVRIEMGQDQDQNEDHGQEILGHSPSLGCCGLADKGAIVLMTPTSNPTSGSGSTSTSGSTKQPVCSYRIDLAIYKEDDKEIIIGINPKMGETIAEEALKQNCIACLQHVKSYTREVKIMNSRFDFAGIDANGTPFVLEIKNVPLADYVDVPKKDRTQCLAQLEHKNFYEKIAYFPDGYRKNSTDVVSPRALKHIQELEEIAKSGTVRAILCFVIQRNDVRQFQTSNIDLIYKEAVYKASQSGVEIITIQVEWTNQGRCYFVRNDLPIFLA
jgi:DNA-binding sugar fermentation-stimulating protein